MKLLTCLHIKIKYQGFAHFVNVEQIDIQSKNLCETNQPKIYSIC